MNKYIVVSIGNTDNRLTQKEWGQFVMAMDELFHEEAGQVHFMGAPANWSPWQNVAWIAEVQKVEIFMEMVSNVRKKFNQDSAFFMCGDGLFV